MNKYKHNLQSFRMNFINICCIIVTFLAMSTIQTSVNEKNNHRQPNHYNIFVQNLILNKFHVHFQMYIEWLIKYNVLNPQWVKLAMSPKKPGGGHSKGENFSGRQRVCSCLWCFSVKLRYNSRAR